MRKREQGRIRTEAGWKKGRSWAGAGKDLGKSRAGAGQVQGRSWAEAGAKQQQISSRTGANGSWARVFYLFGQYQLPYKLLQERAEQELGRSRADARVGQELFFSLMPILCSCSSSTTTTSTRNVHMELFDKARHCDLCDVPSHTFDAFRKSVQKRRTADLIFEGWNGSFFFL